MSVTSAKSLLHIMTVRHGRQVDNITDPHPSVVNAANESAEKLACLDPTAAIDVIVVGERPLHAQYIRATTGELLAEIRAEQLLPADIERKLGQVYPIYSVLAVSHTRDLQRKGA